MTPIATLGANDAVAIPAGQTYGFTVGAEGVAFLLVRTAQATHTHSREAEPPVTSLAVRSRARCGRSGRA